MENTIAVFVVVLVAAVFGGGVVGCEKIKCLDVGETTGRKTYHSIYSGCYIEVDGRMIPRDSWRGEQEK